MAMQPRIIKIGSSILVTRRHHPDRRHITLLLSQVARLVRQGQYPVLVVSGAVACGRGIFPDVSIDTEENRQMLAGAGQAVLTTTFQALAKRQSLCVSQVLLTQEDIDNRIKRERIVRILHKTLQRGCVPVINENDAVSLNSFGGNDYLAQEIARLMEAVEVIICTNVQGLLDYSRSSVIATIDQGKNMNHLLRDVQSAHGVGGMRAKLSAAQCLQQHGIATTIVDGRASDILLRLIIKREKIGTRFLVR